MSLAHMHLCKACNQFSNETNLSKLFKETKRESGESHIKARLRRKGQRVRIEVDAVTAHLGDGTEVRPERYTSTTCLEIQRTLISYLPNASVLAYLP